MYKCLSDVIVSAITGDGLRLVRPLDPEEQELLDGISDTVMNLEQNGYTTDSSPLEDWLTDAVKSKKKKEGHSFIAIAALHLRATGYTLRWLEQAWEAARWR